MLLLLAILFATTSASNLTCHCLDGTKCHTNGYCERGCEGGWSGPGCQVSNVALGKAANQSSTYYEGALKYTYTAGLAVDGQKPGEYARYCSHTESVRGTGSAWWSVLLDTAKYYVITNITIMNRIDDGWRKRLTNFKILYSDETEGFPDPLSSIWHECAEESGAVGTQKTYTCKNTAIAKRVAVYLKTESTNNPSTILTLCEVQVYGYQHHVCQSGYTGPGCLLRTCDQCDLNIGQCSGDNGSCIYNVCPSRSLLPPDCWITLSDYSAVDIRAAATCNKLLYTVNLPALQPNIAASLLQLQVRTSNGQLVVNTTIPVRGVNSTTFNYSYAAASTSYEVSVKPLYCDIPDISCFYATSSNTFKESTGTREYVFSYNGSCVFVNVKSATPDCEPPTEVKVTCQSDIVDGGAVNSSSLSTCGLQRDQGYTCSLAALVNANTIEWANARIVTGLLSSSRAPEYDSHVLAGSIGGSTAVIVVIAAIVAFVYCRRQRDAKSPALVISQDTNVKSHLPAGTLDETKLSVSYKEQRESSYESLNMELGLQTTGDYASLNYTT